MTAKRCRRRRAVAPASRRPTMILREEHRVIAPGIVEARIYDGDRIVDRFVILPRMREIRREQVPA